MVLFKPRQQKSDIKYLALTRPGFKSEILNRPRSRKTDPQLGEERNEW